ncbi:MAG: hypothetical protein AAF533_29375 [Acidobacteriota bacterium]
MPGHRDQLLGGLLDRGWEQLRVDLQGTDWWAAEHWWLRSTREQYGLELVISFLVDPQFEGQGPKSSAVWVIVATEELPSGYMDMGLARLPLQRGRFDRNLQSFLDELDAWRRGGTAPLA